MNKLKENLRKIRLIATIGDFVYNLDKKIKSYHQSNEKTEPIEPK